MPSRTEGEAFLFYFERWRGSRPVQRMSFAERGIFLEMLIEQWMRGDLPDDPRAVADAIATSDAQVGEVEASWPAVRRQFATVERHPGRMQNVQLEKVRRERRSYLKWLSQRGKSGAQARWKHTEPQEVSSMQKHSLSMPLDGNRTGLDRTGKDLDRTGSGEIARARSASILDGSLPRDHKGHVFCDQTFAVCVPSAVHAKLIGPYSRRCGGDREQAHRELKDWYATVAESLPPDFVMGDAFKFWQGRFDAAFASPDSPTKQQQQYGSLDHDAAKVRAILGER